MKDPFFIAPIPWLVDLSRPWCERLNLPSLPLHIHEVLAAALFYSAIFYPISPLVSRLLAPNHYPKLSRKKQLHWDAHVVSMVQSTLISGLAIWVTVHDDERKHMDWEERVWGYTGGAALVQAFAAGYFLWDFTVTSLNIDVFGFGTLAHAIAALLVYALGFRPFLNYYGCIFILWELSTPFLNVHWFLDKVNMTGTRVQLYNGFVLLFTFFSCRLLYGTYQSWLVFWDVWAAINTKPNIQLGEAKAHSGIMAFVSETSTVPVWLAVSYLASNLTLNSLNCYWFVMMIKAVRKRFEPGKQLATEVEVDLSSVSSAIPGRPKVKRRVQ